MNRIDLVKRAFINNDDKAIEELRKEGEIKLPSPKCEYCNYHYNGVCGYPTSNNYYEWPFCCLDEEEQEDIINDLNNDSPHNQNKIN